MFKIFKNGILNVCEFFFLSDINIYVNIGIGDFFLKKEFGMLEIFYFCWNFFIFIEYGELCKNNFDIIMDIL